MTTEWIRHLAADIADRFNRPQAERMLEDVIREAVRDNAPDAESLAVALGKQIANCKGMSEYGHGMNLTIVHGSCCSEARAALAAHPAQVSTEVVLGNK